MSADPASAAGRLALVRDRGPDKPREVPASWAGLWGRDHFSCARVRARRTAFQGAPLPLRCRQQRFVCSPRLRATAAGVLPSLGLGRRPLVDCIRSGGWYAVFVLRCCGSISLSWAFGGRDGHPGQPSAGQESNPFGKKRGTPSHVQSHQRR